MKIPLLITPRKSRRHRQIFAAALLLAAFVLPAAADDTWTGQGGDTNWSTGGNWDGGVPNNTYGILYFNNNNNGKTTNTDDISSMAQNGLRWYDSASWVINTSNTSNVINLYDNGGFQSEIENYSTGSVTINVGITFAANNSRSGSNSNPFGQIDAINGDLTFGSSETLTVGGPGSTVDGLRLMGSASHTINFNGTVNATNATNGGVGDKYIAFIGTVANGVGSGTNATVNGTFNSGDIYLENGSTLNLGSGGTINTSALRLGGDFGNVGYENLAAGATFNLTSASGGQTFSGIINSVTGNTSNALVINSQNTSGTNTLSGGIYLDSALTINATSAGGTLALNGPMDIKNQTLNLGGAGVIVAANGLQSYSSGGGTVNYNGSGTLLVNGSSNNPGNTNINSGALGGTGSLAGPVNVNSGATLHPGSGASASTGVLTTGALTLASSSTSDFDLVSTQNYGHVMANGSAALSGALMLNIDGAISPGDTFDLVHASSLSGAYNGIVNDGIYTFGGQQFRADYTSTDFTVTAVPEPQTWIAGALLTILAGTGLRGKVREKRLTS